MWLRLAQRFGIPAGELMQRMSRIEFALHCRMEQEEPQGWPANRVLFGVVAAATRNAAGGIPTGRKSARAARIDDFFPEPSRRSAAAPAQTVEQQIAILTRIFGAPKQ